MTNPIQDTFECVVVSPSVGRHANLAIGASLAGGIGVLDLCFSSDVDQVAQRRRLQDFLTRTPDDKSVGVRCRSDDLELAEPLFDLLEKRPHQLILYGDTPARLAAAAARFRGHTCYRLLVEVTQTQGFASIAAPQSGVDGVIVCGQECGGVSGSTSSFLLAQQLLATECLPVYVKGAPGLNSAAACRAVGARGVVLDHQLLLLPESPLPKSWQSLLSQGRFQDFQQIGAQDGAPVGVFLHPRFKATGLLKAASQRLEVEPSTLHEFQLTVGETVGWGSPENRVWPLGQTAGWAGFIAERYRSVGHLVADLLAQTGAQVSKCGELLPLSPDSPMAISHRTRYPIVQGPMTRVSDCPLFARAVADNGALPMISLALADGEKTAGLLSQTAELLGGASWGVGILGFVSPEIQQAQLAEVLKAKPPFALIAGGRPSQAKTLESEGIATYLHAPVASLIPRFLEQGARRFVLEGRECGGHVGPLSSLVLWESAVQAILENLPRAEKVSVLFAGGIHDARSAAMVSALSVPLVEAGVEVGVLMGTSYLFTEEAVATGAIAQGFQQAALDCSGTVTLESAVGHANRCADTPFSRQFSEEKRRLLKEGCSPEVVRERLDDLLMGRLRQATRGVKRDESGHLVEISAEEQQDQGMYMMGEVAALRHRVLTMQQLHQEVSEDSARQFLAAGKTFKEDEDDNLQACEVAIVGLSLSVPGADDKDKFWNNLSRGRIALSEIPANRWESGLYYDENKLAPDMSYSRWGGWMNDFVFDPLKYGMPPNRWDSVNPNQLISLELAHRALADAGYEHRPFDRSRTSTIVAAGDMGMLGIGLMTRSFLKLLDDAASANTLERLPEWTADSFPGVLGSICSGRVANRLDLGGSNFVVDAACASSFTAVDMACHELMSGRADQVLVGGVDIGQTPFDYTGFSKVQALSPTGNSKPFDKSADGIVLSEGAAFMVLKRLDDALRDGDKVYAVIRGVGTSSDGRTMGLTAPHSGGQLRALERAWKAAGLEPGILGLYEAHATGTSLGDKTELETISKLLTTHQAETASCALGSVKSLIGHTKRAAGLVSLAKAALSLHHKVLPPHGGIEEPLEALHDPESPVCLYQKPQPWFENPEKPRTAAVSAFGFGGTNAHVVLQEFEGSAPGEVGGPEWPAELILLGEESGRELAEQVETLLAGLENAEVRLADLAFSLAAGAEDRPTAGRCAALVVESVEELRSSLWALQLHLQDESRPLPDHIYLSRRSGIRAGKAAFLFPGQGSQYVSCAREMVLYFNEFRQAVEEMDKQLGDRYSRLPSQSVYPPRALNAAQRASQRERLTDTHLAQPLLGTLGWASYRLMRRLGFQLDCVAGHSYGEYSALCAAQSMDFPTLLTLSEARGRAMASIEGEDCGGMAAVTACRSIVEEYLSPQDSVVIANHNSPDQTVISGPTEELQRVLEQLKERDIRAVKLEVSGGFHSPVMRAAQKELTKTIRSVQLTSPGLPVYSNLNGQPYPANPAGVLEQLKIHLLGSVEFVAQVQSMSRDGVRTFIEMAPGGTLSNLVRSILPEQDILALSLDRRGGGLKDFLLTLARLRSEGVPFTPVALFDDRVVKRLPLESLPQRAVPSATSWLVNPTFVLPLSDTTPRMGRKPLRAAESASEPSVSIEFPKPAPTAQRRPAPPTSAMPPATPIVPAAPLTGPVMPSHTGPQPGLSDSRVVQAYEAYQQTMQQFLRTQEQVMANFLQSLGTSESPTHQEPARPIEPPAVVEPVLSELPDEPGSTEVPEEPTKVGDLNSIEQELVRIVSKQTGYPAEMLALDADLEADLGIDSIKRLEIMDDLTNLLADASMEEVRDATDNLIRLRTLSELAAAVADLLSPEEAPPEVRLPARYLMQGLPQEASSSTTLSGHYLLIPDRGSVGDLLASQLREMGCQVSEWNPEAPVSGPFAGVIHLSGLDSEPLPRELSALRQVTEHHILSLLDLFQTVGRSALSEAVVLVGGRWGGRFGREGQVGPGSVFAVGASGLARTLATEWPELRHTVVDLSSDLAPEQVVLNLITELTAGEAEVGYYGGVRHVFRASLEPIQPVEAVGFMPRDGVLLATGGARGITAEVVCGMVQAGNRVILLGRTELNPEPPEVVQCETPEQLRTHFIENQSGRSPAQIESQVGEILRQREVGSTLQRLRSLGCEVSYRVADMSDEPSVKNLFSHIYSEFGRIDTVIHGAGIIEDKLVEDKTLESFHRVYRTKVEGLFHLLSAIRWDSLKNLVLFSSVAGRFGNRGQADYAAANEVLNMWACRLAEEHSSTRVLSVNWGPWDGLGMSKSGHRQAFLDREIIPIDVAEGRAYLGHELTRSGAGSPVVVVGEGEWSKILDGTARSAGKRVRS